MPKNVGGVGHLVNFWCVPEMVYLSDKPIQGITHYTYDHQGYIASVTDQNGVRYLENQYDEQGRITRQTFENGIYQTFTYDDKHRRNTVYYSETGKQETYEYNKCCGQAFL